MKRRIMVSHDNSSGLEPLRGDALAGLESNGRCYDRRLTMLRTSLRTFAVGIIVFIAGSAITASGDKPISRPIPLTNGHSQLECCFPPCPPLCP